MLNENIRFFNYNQNEIFHSYFQSFVIKKNFAIDKQPER